MSNISVGMTLPDFELPDQDGTLRKLSDLQGDNAMVLSLGRGEHCPRERQHQRELVRFWRQKSRVLVTTGAASKERSASRDTLRRSTTRP